MEKFSAFRDPSTGLAPFAIPVPASTSFAPALYALYPLLGALAAVRMLALCALLLLCWLLSCLFLPLKYLQAKTAYDKLDRAQTAVLLRLALAVLGYLWVPVELSSLKRGFASSSRSMEIPISPSQGDLVVSNWTSWVDVLYIAFRYNPTFLQPIVDQDDRIVGFKTVGWLHQLWRSARLPQVSSTKSVADLNAVLSSETRPCCVFPELTTTNNRALLQFSSEFASTASSSLCKIPPKTRLFALSFKHELPSLFKCSATLTVPTLFTPFTHAAALCLWPGLRSLQVRLLHSSERPTSWLAAQDAVAQLGKFKTVKGLSWKDKRRFLAYRQNSAK